MGKSNPFVEVKTNTGSTCRDPTVDEMLAARERRKTIIYNKKKIARLKARIAELGRAERMCPHTVAIDEDGFMYDQRSCYACGTSLGLI